MRFEIELCHVDSTRTIVKAIALSDKGSLGSALGQGNDVDEAESQAILKIQKRLKTNSDISEINSTEKNMTPITRNSSSSSNTSTLTKDKHNDDLKSFPIPEDWSNELNFIDKALTKLSWNKKDENLYLKRLFGYNSRSKITSYKELKIYLYSLKSIKIGYIPEDIDLSKNTLINNTSILLDKLNWDSLKGREFINKNFKCNSRNELTELQLIEFLMLLEEINLQSNNKVNK